MYCCSTRSTAPSPTTTRTATAVDKNLADLIPCVTQKKFHLGVAFDGDADRIGAVDERGKVLRCDTLIALYAQEVLKDFPGATIVGDVKCSQIMYDEIARLGGKPLMWKTGHSLIKAKMYELNAPLAGELSGHIFFGHKFYGHDDGIYCAVRLMNIVANADVPASGLSCHLPDIYNTPEVKLRSRREGKIQPRPQGRGVGEGYLKNESWQVNEIDGVRVTTPEGWWLLRASNTQNVLVTRAESQSAKGLETLKSMVKTEAERIGYDIAFAMRNWTSSRRIDRGCWRCWRAASATT